MNFWRVTFVTRYEKNFCKASRKNPIYCRFGAAQNSEVSNTEVRKTAMHNIVECMRSD